MRSLFVETLQCLVCFEVESKLASTAELMSLWQHGQLEVADDNAFTDVEYPGRPDKPVLVDPRALPQRKLSSPEGVGAFVHALAHIEFNAINLALDAVYRFRGLPDEFYADWLSVAADEARHFRLLSARLSELGWSYGDFDAHDGLWDAARRSAHDPMVRMALIPRVFEARGLDVAPGMIKRLDALGDRDTAAILEVILADEVAHVEAGSRWFRYFCDQRGLNSDQVFADLLEEYGLAGKRSGPMHREARLRAGFSENELEFL